MAKFRIVLRNGSVDVPPILEDNGRRQGSTQRSTEHSLLKNWAKINNVIELR